MTNDSYVLTFFPGTWSSLFRAIERSCWQLVIQYNRQKSRRTVGKEQKKKKKKETNSVDRFEEEIFLSKLKGSKDYFASGNFYLQTKREGNLNLFKRLWGWLDVPKRLYYILLCTLVIMEYNVHD